MWNWLMWLRFQDPSVREQLTALREDSLRLFIQLVAAGYLTWHFTTLLVMSTRGASSSGPLSYWALFPIVVGGLVLTQYLERRQSGLTINCFLLTSTLSITAAIWILKSSFATLLIPLLVIAAIVLLHPAGGIVVGVGSLSLLVTLKEAGPLAFLTDDRLLETGIGSLLAAAVAWALGHNLVSAVEWTLSSYNQALRNAREAQENRAELAQAVRQLDHAYYRVERANAALELAWKAAEAAERSKSEFVANISHELRTPLNLIVGFSELIVTFPESYGVPMPTAYRGDLNAIYRSAQHLLALTDDVLDLAWVGMGRLAIGREPVDLKKVISDACDIVREYVEAKGLSIRVDVAPDVPSVSLDHLRIRQVLLNLLTNAARFTDQGGIAIGVSARDGQVIARVSDSGRGIPASELPNVFEKFYHTEGERSGPHAGFGGIGLGLPLSKRFVEMHGGQMGVESTVGLGTTFWFSLPMVAPDRDTSTETPGPLRLPGIGRQLERVLVLVSAEERMASFLRRHVRGSQVIVASDFTTACGAAIETRAIAILMDTNVDNPANYATAPVPVVGLPLPFSQKMASLLGVADFLLKPVTRSDLQAAIAKLGGPFRSVLIVDDDESFIRLLKRQLRAIKLPAPQEVRIAHNGREALTMLQGSRPDLLLLDLAMPEMSGHDVLQAVTADPRLANVPVIVISGHEQYDDQFRLAGPLTVRKPDGFRPEELLNAVESLLTALEPPRRYLTEDATR